MDINFESFLTKKKEQAFLTGTVLSLKPVTIELIPGDTALSIVYTNALKEMKIDSRVLLTKYQDRFIALAVIDSPNVIQDAITIGRTSTQTVTTYNETKVEFDSALTTVGNRLSYDSTNKGVKIGKGVKTVEVSLCLWLERYAGSYSSIYIYKNATQMNYSIRAANVSGMEIWNTQYNSILVSVTENDLIYGYTRWSVAHASTNIIAGAYVGACTLTVKVVELDL